ncbi:hypothetical protein PJJ28_14515 [Mycobacterium kansasii]
MSFIDLPKVVTVHFSSGNASIGLTINPYTGAMRPVLTFTDLHGQRHIIELLADECAKVGNDLVRLCNASPEQVLIWRLELECAE